MRTTFAQFAAGIALLSLVGCQSTTGKTAGQSIDDATITAAVQAKLSSDRISNFSRVDVDTERGVVTLNGVVKSADQKIRVADLTRQVNGVRTVNNNLQIQSP
jgi:hyperosmotically inducible protein